MQKFLMLYANPSKLAKLDFEKEFRKIQDELEKSNSDIQLVNVGDVKKSDLNYKLGRHKPVLVQFNGHGSADSEIALEDEKGKLDIVERKMLEEVFKYHAAYVKCVILACCYGRAQAKAISKHIPFVVGMQGLISDSVTRVFSSAFIYGLSKGLTIQEAFDRAKTEIGLIKKSHKMIPKLHSSTAYDPNKFRIVEEPKILARFKTNKKGVPLINTHYEGYRLYKTEVYISHPPPDTSVVLYQYVDDAWTLSQQIEQIEHHVKDFTDTLDEDGDIEMRATLWSPRGGVAIKTSFAQALKEHYGKRMSVSIRESIRKIENNR